MCSNFGTPKTINFPFGTNGKLMVLGVPIFKHFRVYLEWFKVIKQTPFPIMIITIIKKCTCSKSSCSFDDILVL